MAEETLSEIYRHPDLFKYTESQQELRQNGPQPEVAQRSNWTSRIKEESYPSQKVKSPTKGKKQAGLKLFQAGVNSEDKQVMFTKSYQDITHNRYNSQPQNFSKMKENSTCWSFLKKLLGGEIQ